MSIETWEKKVLSRPGAPERVEELEHKLSWPTVSSPPTSTKR